MASHIVFALAIGAPALQALLMGLIGYNYAKNRPGGMEKFHASGFTWWLITLGVVIAGTVVFAPGLVSGNPIAGHTWSVPRFVIVVAIGLAVALAIEVGFELWRIRTGNRVAAKSQERYDDALPPYMRKPRIELVVLLLVAVLEETVYRGVVLTALMDYGLSKPAAAGIAAVSFGLAHWWFGFVQIWLKSILGGVLAAVAFAAGWPAAAVVHILLNAILISIARRDAVAAQPEREVATV